MSRIFLFFASLLVTWIGWNFLYPYHFALPYFETDFVDYCIGVSTWDDSNRHFPTKRSRLAGLIPALFAKEYGVLEGLSMASIFSMGLIAVILSQWTETIHKHAGWYTLAWLLACSPWLGIGRFLNFYPEIVLGLVVGSFSMWLGLNKGTTRPDWMRGILVGLGIGVCAIVDARGLIWSGWFTLCALVWRLWHRETWKQEALFWSGVLCILMGTWYMGRWSFGPYSTSLVRQLDVQPLRMALGISDTQISPLPLEFRWGWEWRGGFDNIRFLFSQQRTGLPSADPSLYWWTWFSLLCLAGLNIAKRQVLLLLLLVPTFIAFLQIGHTVEEHVRFYMQSLPILTPILGIASFELGTVFQNKIISKAFSGIYVQRLTIALGLCALPYLSLLTAHHWNIEREISHKMLSQAHPNHPDLQQRSIVFGNPIHIQTLPVTPIERQLTQDWDTVCTEALRTHPPLVWFE